MSPGDMTRRRFLGASALGAGAALAAPRYSHADAATGRSGRRPSILFIMTDQQWGGCTGYAGHPHVRTPNLDALARDGVAFDSAHCAYPVCTASRCSILTGTWPHTHGENHNVSGAPEPDPAKGLQPDAVLTETLLHEHGYVTRHCGKWHAGDQRRHACYQAEDGCVYLGDYGRHIAAAAPPGSLGASKGQATLWGHPVYMQPPVAALADGAALGPEPYWPSITTIGRTAIPPELTETSFIVDETLARLDRYRDDDFMITCSVHPPHDPCVVPDPWYSMYDPNVIDLPSNQSVRDDERKTAGGKLFDGLGPEGVREFMRVYFANVSFVDMHVGRLVAKLKEIGRYDDTIIVFTSDHGDMCGAHGLVTKSVTPAWYDEIARVPLLMSCPNLMPRDRRVNTMANGVDLMPTLLDYAGVAAPEQAQGQSLRPFIEGREDLERAAFGELTHETAQVVGRMIRTQDWWYSFIYQNWSTSDKTFAPWAFQLYHMTEDPGQKVNLVDVPECREVRIELDARLRRHLRETEDGWAERLPPCAPES